MLAQRNATAAAVIRRSSPSGATNQDVRGAGVILAFRSAARATPEAIGVSSRDSFQGLGESLVEDSNFRTRSQLPESDSDWTLPSAITMPSMPGTRG